MMKKIRITFVKLGKRIRSNQIVIIIFWVVIIIAVAWLIGKGLDTVEEMEEQIKNGEIILK